MVEPAIGPAAMRAAGSTPDRPAPTRSLFPTHLDNFVETVEMFVAFNDDLCSWVVGGTVGQYLAACARSARSRRQPHARSRSQEWF